MTRQATDGLYIELDYYEPENYYVYVAEASSAQSSSCSISIEAVKTVAVECTASSEFTQATIGSRTKDIDLFAFAEGALISQAQIIRDNNISLSTEFTVAAAVASIRDYESDHESVISIIVDNERGRDNDSNIEAAFNFDCVFDRLRDHEIITSADTETNIVAVAIVDYIATVESTSTSTIEPLRIFDFSIATDSVATKLAIVVKVGESIIDCATESNVTVSAIVTASGGAELISEMIFPLEIIRIIVFPGFPPPVEVITLPNPFIEVTRTYLIETVATIDLDSDVTAEFVSGSLQIADFTTDITAVKTTDIDLAVTNDIVTDITAVKTTDIDLAVTSDFEIDIISIKTTDVVIDASVEVTVDATALRIFDFDIVSESVSSKLAIVVKTGVFIIDAAVSSVLDITAVKTASGASDVSAIHELIIAEDRLRDNDSQSIAEFVLDLDAVKTTDIIANQQFQFTFPSGRPSILQPGPAGTQQILPTFLIYRSFDIDLDVVVDIMIDAVATLVADSTTSSQFDMVTVEDRRRDNDSVMTNDVVMQAEAIKTTDVIGDFASAFTFPSDRPFTPQPGPAGTLQILPTFLTYKAFDVDASASIGFVLEPIAQLVGESDQSSIFDAEIIAVKTVEATSDFEVVASEFIFGVKTTSINLVAFSQGDMVIDAVVDKSAVIDISAETGLEITAQKLRRAEANLDSNTELVFESKIVRDFVISMEAFNTKLTFGRKSRLDAIVYKIASETRTHKIRSR